MRPGSLVNPTWREPTQLEVRPGRRRGLWFVVTSTRLPGGGLGPHPAEHVLVVSLDGALKWVVAGGASPPKEEAC